ncbi:MAG: diguanylate cyclase, partial [Gammaproteobacteria bacterium]
RLRGRLEDMSLYPDEQRLYEQAMDIIRVTAPLQEEIIQNSIDDEHPVHDALLKRDIPLEKELWRVFDELLEASQAHLAEEAWQNEQANRRASIMVVALGILAVIIALIAMVRVVQHTREHHEALRTEKEHAEMTLSSIGDAVIVVNEEGNITFINFAAQKMLGCSAAQAVGKPLRRYYDVLTEEGRLREHHIAFDSFLTGPAVSVSRHHVLKLPSGSECIIEDVIAPMHDRHGNFLGNTIIFRDVTQARLIEQRLSWQALHDPLTGLPNRLQFETKFKEMLLQVHRSNVEHVMLVIDLDNFKPVNDTCGHMAGDMLLKEIANTLTHKMRKSDTLARLGGDEFAVLLDGCSVKQAEVIAESLRRAIEQLEFSWEGHSFQVGASIGLCAINRRSSSFETVMSQADSACYAAKKAGRNRVNVFPLSVA